MPAFKMPNASLSVSCPYFFADFLAGSSVDVCRNRDALHFSVFSRLGNIMGTSRSVPPLPEDAHSIS